MVSTIDVGLTHIDKIFHIADIHIRNLKRHVEYKEVFNKLLTEIRARKTPNSIIYLAGDIAHAKTEMSPELISMISKLLIECAIECPTVVIPGNHDANLNNSYRMDVLSPIVESINNERIIYLKDSGVFKIANINFVHYGIFQSKDEWPSVKDVDGYNIGLFHGPIHSSHTDIGYIVSNKAITVNSFHGCDIVMCGDIHRRQIVQTGDDMMIVYAGSLIQQNHGESLDGHGFVEWSLNSDGKVFDCEFIDIQNDWGYYTLTIDNGIVPIVTDMPRNPRLRIRVINTDASKLKRVLAKVRSKYNVKEFTVTRMDTLSRLNTGDRDTKLNFGNISDIEYQNELIREYLERHYFVDSEAIQDIYKINRALNAELDENEIAKNVNWKPKKFTFSNMFSYGENNVIDFTDMNGIYGLFAPNASGKSSIFDAISFCIFDKCSRAFKASHVMNYSKSAFSCLLELEISDVDYFIKRIAKKKPDGTVKVDVEFWRVENGIKEMLNGEARRGTNDTIRQYIGSYEDFVLTTLSLQDKNAIFIDKSQSERKDLLAQFMGIDIFDKLYQLGSDNVRDVSSQIRKMKSVDYDSKLISLEAELVELTTTYAAITNDINQLNTQLSILNNEKLELVRGLVPVNPDITDITLLNSNEIKISELIESITSQITINSADVIAKKKSIKLINKDIQKLLNNDVSLKYTEYKNNVNAYNELNTDIETIRNEIERKSEQLYDYNELEYDIDCQMCVSNADKLESSSVVIKREIKELTNRMKKLLINFNSLIIVIQDSKSIEADWLYYNELQTKLSALEIELAKLETTLAKQRAEKSNNNNRIAKVKTDIEEYYILEDAINNNKKININIKQLDLSIATIMNDIKNVNNNILIINGKLASVQTNLDKCNEDLDLLSNLENTYKTYEYYLEAVKRDGISYELITKALPVIEGEVNNILQQVVDFGMVLEMDGKNINGRIVYESSQWPLEMCSGMERFISGLAIRVALMNVCHLPRSNFLVLDEGMGSLDSNNINNLAWLFDYLKGQFDFIMVISHLDVMRDFIDNLIEIKKVKGFSSVQF